MSLHPELEIARLLEDTSLNVKKVGETLLKRVGETKEPLDCSRTESYANFFLNTGQLSLLFRFCIHLLFNKQPVCWGELLEGLTILRMQLPLDKKDLIFELAKRESRIESLVKSHNLDAQEPRVVELREKIEKKRRAKREKRRTDLLQKFEILRNDHLLDECEQVLNELLRDTPKDPHLLRFQSELENSRASHIIANFRQKPLKKMSPNESEVLTFEEETTIRTLQGALLELTRGNPSCGYDFAILMLFLECPRQGLEILELTTEEFFRDWLRFELLCRASQYVDLMSESYILAQRYATDPETHFAVSYGRALALWGLGQRESAITALEGIVRIRPSYRSAHALLCNWKREIS